jgi:hypothetical protein
MDSKNDLKPVFFCVPDITGFTRFVATADITFAKEVIPALLRRLIEANLLKMSVAEIEGDAIFFYKTGRLPSVKRVAEQCKLFYRTFLDFMDALEKSDPDSHQKYVADQLGLKVIIHYGAISCANIKGRTKLLGEDVIIAHKVLKNSIAEDNYILFTDKYLKKIKEPEKLNSWFDGEQLIAGSEEFEYIGEVTYHYISLEKIRRTPEIMIQRKIS